MKRPFVNVTIPVFNEDATLAANVSQVVRFLNAEFAYPHEVVIANNGSTDQTQAVAEEVSCKYGAVRVVQLARPGRGDAVAAVWRRSEADVVSYMDCDLSSDLAAFPKLVEPLIRGTADLSTGSRLLNPSTTSRGLKREVLSRGYNLLVKALFRTRFSDAQCGFKAITREAAMKLLPLIRDQGWFFDTELLVLADRAGFRIHDLPVHWVDDPDSRVRIGSTIIADLAGLARLRCQLSKCERYLRRQ